MSVVYVARSKGLQKWSADVGLTKHVYKVGVAEDAAAAIQALNDGAHAGESDWRLVKKQRVDGLDEDTAIARLAAKEKMVDPAYYPKIKGARGLFKVKVAEIARSMLVQQAVAGGEMSHVKVKPADLADHLIRTASE
jgi:hypothetical protein